MVSIVTGPHHHDVLVVGGGNAGISLAAKLRRDGCRDVAIVEPKDVHEYRPLLSYVAGGMATLDDLRRPQAEAMPRGVRWYRDAVTSIDPARSAVRLASGGELTYSDLAVCPGSQVDWDAVPGAQDAVRTGAASTNYLPEHAPATWEMLSALTSGTAVFAISDRHVPCAPVGLKPLFLAADHWRRTGVLDAITVELVVEADRLVDLDESDQELRAAAAEYGVRVRTATSVESVDGASRRVRLRTPDGPDEIRYDTLYLAPPHRAPGWLASSGLTSPESDGFLAVDPVTLQHRDHATVWGLGDAAEVDALPSGGALRKQVPVVAHNIAARRTGATMRHYDGYSVGPVTTSRTQLLLAEFDRQGRKEPTLRVPDLARPRRSLLVFDRYVEPQIYWRRLLRGKVS
ncbi:FAD dependent oxidoreductase [Cellulomonas fimi ATCC 484]|uniref:FAD dependent oxidoreductase n=1 Tax=Cellulomonas fimi (strain ATCC 484 / DSM 20113 / JCM 1341 / CCUG 24087 / LMG 16345 / NBRC 15513 / NCIMB 8980 / NCTC 7547 / NRS-133) TaxID=590998 RepID=F4H5E6_CELFA|nr:FAD dependent oxidoreductase [Cellulomonas fimi ATCC 484]